MRPCAHLLGMASLALLGCKEDVLMRMKVQPKYLPYEANAFFEDDLAMRTPPEGTVSRERYLVDRPELRGGRPDGGYSMPNPVPLTPQLLAQGRRTFDVFCSPCHGMVGDGQSVVGGKMTLRAPPSLHLRAQMPDAFFYDAVTYGYGVMPPYAEHLSAQERWGVVAYVRALQLSQRARLESAPPEVRQRLQREARP